VDEWSANTLTHIHGYRSLEYEFISQTGVFGEKFTGDISGRGVRIRAASWMNFALTMSETMKQAFGLVRRPWGVFYLKHKITGEQKSLKTSDKCEAQRILQAHNESECQPHFNLSLARVYLNGADPKLATRTGMGEISMPIPRARRFKGTADDAPAPWG
jgi:hypothetical protein